MKPGKQRTFRLLVEQALRATLAILAPHAVYAAAPSPSGTYVAVPAMQKSLADATDGDAANKPAAAKLDVNQLFASSCGWCHADGGRIEGKGPQLMGTQLTDSEIMNRIKNGKSGRMPGFGTTFNDDQLKDIVAYIRNLKPNK